MDLVDYGIVLYELRCIAGPCLKVLDDYTSVDVWRVLRKDLSFVVFVLRSFFNRPELSRGDELCGLHRCTNPTGLSC